MSWQPFKPVQGILVAGDKKQQSLSGWRILRYIQKGWRLKNAWDTLTVIEVRNDGTPYYVGFTDIFGDTGVLTTPITTPRFAGLLGREPCTFFAVFSLDDPQPLDLREVDRRPKNDPGDGVTVI